MKKILVAAALGAMAMFVWQFLTWSVFPVHQNTFKDHPDENAVKQAFEGVEVDGAYFIPGPENERASLTDGPVIISFYSQEGTSFSQILRIIFGLIIDFISLFIICSVLYLVIDMLDTFAKRIIFILGLGVGMAFITHIYQWNWFFFSDYFLMMMLIDFLGGWVIASVVIALILKPVHRYIVP